MYTTLGMASFTWKSILQRIMRTNKKTDAYRQKGISSVLLTRAHCHSLWHVVAKATFFRCHPAIPAGQSFMPVRKLRFASIDRYCTLGVHSQSKEAMCPCHPSVSRREATVRIPHPAWQGLLIFLQLFSIYRRIVGR